MIVSETAFVARYAETDQMGVVHHSHYPVWFEAGRTDFIKKMGMPYSKVEEDGAMLPLIELKCNYKGFARYEDEIVVKTRVKENTGVKLTFYYEIFKNGAETPITTGETVHVWTNRDLKPVNLKKYRPELFGLVESAR